MTGEESVEETVMLTRRDRRRAAANAASATDGADAQSTGLASDDEATFVVDRSPAPPATTDVPAAPPEPSDDEAQHAGEQVDEATVVVDRSPRPVSEPLEEATVVVARTPGRSRRRAEAADPPAPEPSDPEPSWPEPRDVVAEAFAAPAVPEPAIYKPRPAPLGPSAPPVVIGGVPPTRVQDAERPSVAKHSRRWSTLTLAAFAVACAVSAAGLVGVGFLVFG
jgi:hypothetical protein